MKLMLFIISMGALQIVARKCEKSPHEKMRYKGVTQPEIHKVQMLVNKRKKTTIWNASISIAAPLFVQG